MTADIIHLIPDTSPPARDYKAIAEWMHEQADLIESGDYPDLERVIMIWYEPNKEEGSFSFNTHGTRSINRAECIGLLEIAVHKQKDMIK